MDEVERRLKALMLRTLDGEREAEAALLTALAALLRPYFVRRLGSEAGEAEDLVQETLISIHAKRAAFDVRQPFTPWIYAIARYRLIDHYRRRRSRRESPLEAAADLADGGGFPEAEARHDLERLLESLPERQRRLVQDVKIAGLSIDETSRRSGLSGSAVKVAVHRAVGALAKRVRDAN